MTARARIGRGSLSGTLAARADAAPGLRGSLTIEQDVTLAAGSHVYLVGWIRDAAGTPFISLTIERGEGGGRLR